MQTPVSWLYQNAESHNTGCTKLAVVILQSDLQKDVKKWSGLAGMGSGSRHNEDTEDKDM